MAKRGAHLAVLSAFALAQPLFDILAKNPEFFAVRGSTSREIVLFALGLTVLPPAALLLLEIAARAVNAGLARGVHLLIVGCLAVLFAAQALKKAEGLSGTLAIAGAVAGGVAATAAYARWRLVQTTLTVLSPAPLVFAALFLFASPVTKLVLVEDVEVPVAGVRARTPVVLVVFDELSTVSLLDRRGMIDARRYPNFAALARDALWYRDATTIHAHTEVAVPAILTGRVPDEGDLPIVADHPRNLFTLLGRGYDLHVIETLTHLCPPKLCKRSRPAQDEEVDVVGERTESLLSDASVVYLHLVLPDAFATRLPPVTDTWGDFRGKADRAGTGARRARGGECGRKLCSLAALVRPARSGTKPPLYFVHSLLPHVPWQYLPSGHRYSNNRRVVGVEEARWADDHWLTIGGYQRYLLQLGYTDRALGILLRRLKSAGLYGRALVVVTADHGVSFVPGEPRRLVTPENLESIAFMPLFVKPPGLGRGRVIDGFARTVDVLPTIASALGIRLAWETDGRSLLSGGVARDGAVSVATNAGNAVEAPLSQLLGRRAAALRRQISIFGTGTWGRVYRAGPRAELVGRRVSSLPSARSGGARVEVDGGTRVRPADPGTDLVPSYVTGTVSGGDAARTRELAIAVAGEIVATARTYTAFGRTQFGAMLPPRALRTAGELAVFEIRGSEGNGIELAQLAGSTLSYRLVERPGREELRSSAGMVLPIAARVLAGTVRGTLRRDTALFGGWAGDLAIRQPVDAIVVIAGRSSVYTAKPGTIPRGDIANRYGIDGAGFIFELPRATLPPPRDGVLRVFAVRGAVASELAYAPGYPWRTRGA